MGTASVSPGWSCVSGHGLPELPGWVLARRALRSTGLPELLSQRALWGSSHTKPGLWSCLPCTVPSLLRGGNPSAGELEVSQRCWERNNPSQQPLPEHLFRHSGTHVGAAAGNQPPGLPWCQQRWWPYSQEHRALLGLVPVLCCRGCVSPCVEMKRGSTDCQ